MSEVMRIPNGAVMGPEMILPDQRNWGDYHQFLERNGSRRLSPGSTTFPDLKPCSHISEMTAWALRLGRAAVFAGTGLGKSLIELIGLACLRVYRRSRIALAPWPWPIRWLRKVRSSASRPSIARFPTRTVFTSSQPTMSG